MEIITKKSPSDYILDELKVEAMKKFAGRFKDLNEINDGEKIRLYLTSKNGGDEANFDNVLNQHDPADIISKKDAEKLNRKNRKKDILQKLGITANDIQSLQEVLEDGNDD